MCTAKTSYEVKGRQDINHIYVLPKIVMANRDKELTNEDKEWCSLKLLETHEQYGMLSVDEIQKFMSTMKMKGENYIQQQLLIKFYKNMTNAWKFRQNPLCLQQERIELWLYGTYICTLTGCVEMREPKNSYKITVRMRNGDEERWKLEYDEDGDTFEPLSVVYKNTDVSAIDVANDVKKRATDLTKFNELEKQMLVLTANMKVYEALVTLIREAEAKVAAGWTGFTESEKAIVKDKLMNAAAKIFYLDENLPVRRDIEKTQKLLENMTAYVEEKKEMVVNAVPMNPTQFARVDMDQLLERMQSYCKRT